MAEKNYVGNGWKKTFTNGGSIISLSLNLEKLKALPTDNYGNIRLTVGELKNPGKANQTHYVAEDDYRKGQQAQQTEQPKPTTTSTSSGELPDIDVEDINIDMPF